MGRPSVYPWSEWWSAARSEFGIHVDTAEMPVTRRFLQMQANARARKDRVHLKTWACRRHKECLRLKVFAHKPWDWDELLDGRPHGLYYDDLGCQPESFIRNARRAAAARGMTLITDRKTNVHGIRIQGVKKS